MQVYVEQGRTADQAREAGLSTTGTIQVPTSPRTSMACVISLVTCMQTGIRAIKLPTCSRDASRFKHAL